MKRNICVFLSGGLDSRVLTYYLFCLLGKNIVAFTFGAKSDEILIADRVAKELGGSCNRHIRFRLSSQLRP